MLSGSNYLSSDQKQVQAENKRLEEELKKLKELEQELLINNKNT